MAETYLSYIKHNVKIRDICRILGIPVYSGTSGDRCSCPFHDDHTPSMYLYNDSNLAYCFSCKKSWDNLEFIGEKLDLDFQGRLSWMENHFPELLKQKITFPVSPQKTLQSGYDIAFQAYSNMSDKEQRLLKEFCGHRGFEEPFFEKQSIFCAAKNKLSSLYCRSENSTDANLTIEERLKLEDCKLVIKLPWQERQTAPRYSDHFSRDGIIIPLRDSSGKLVGFAQRALDGTQPKYLFSKNLPKKTLLYGIDSLKKRLSAAKANQKTDIFLVEGIFDALRIESREKKNISALAVLGNRLTKTQAGELQNVLSGSSGLSIHICMDADRAGRTGNLETLKSLWAYSDFMKCYIDFWVPLGEKDPDDAIQAALKTLSDTGASAKSGSNKAFKRLSVFEYIVYCLLPADNELLLSPLTPKSSVSTAYQKLSTEAKLLCLSRVRYLFSRSTWDEIFRLYGSIIADSNHSGMQSSGNTSADSEAFFYRLIHAYVTDSSIGENDRTAFAVPAVTYDAMYHFKTALQIAKTSYDRESLPLDQASWERILSCADAFFAFFRETFEEHRNIKIPLLSIYYPKKLNEYRMKSVYIHERLILQQYILNELLRADDRNCEALVPAVRYSQGTGRLYTTFWNQTDETNDTLSFAYQIDMDVLSGQNDMEHGMFRNYYDCWKGYIEYIQDGISRLNSDNVYRVKLDIRGYYDHIPRYAVRNVLFKTISELIRIDNDKFSLFFGKNSAEERIDLQEKAETVTRWILDELFEPYFYDPQTGERRIKDNSTVGIPQGPNLSAYIANIILFDMDHKIRQYMENINSSDSDSSIQVRYARYVDDMIIIASNARDLNHIKDLILNELYSLGLTLSPKTDREDSIPKEEALEWTTSEKGGLGVSASFDFPDDPLDDTLDDLDGYEITDRRSALKLLQSSLYLTDDELLSKKIDTKQFIQALFRTEEIRFGDMVRIAEVLLLKLSSSRLPESATDPAPTLLERFTALWTLGRQESPEGSLFRSEGIEIFAFIEGCGKILKNRSSLRFRNQPRQDACKEISEYFFQKNSLSAISCILQKQELLTKNRWILLLRLAEICSYLQVSGAQIRSKLEGYVPNEYTYRWFYALEEHASCSLKTDFPRCTEEKTLTDFHHAVSLLSALSLPDRESKEAQEASKDSSSDEVQQYNTIQERFKEIQSSLRESSESTVSTESSTMLGRCLNCWFSNHDTPPDTEENVRLLSLSLLTLLGVIQDSVKADIISLIPEYQNHLFQARDAWSYCLPILPGVGYPGLIMAKASMDVKAGYILKRTDFISNPMVEPDKNWDETAPGESLSASSAYHLYKSNLEVGFVPLDTLISTCENNDLSADKCQTMFECLIQLYMPLCEMFKKLTNFAPAEADGTLNTEYSVILSKKHIFVRKAADSSSYDIQAVAYLLPKSTAGDGVLIEQGKGRFSFKPLYGDGISLWKAGWILRDICSFDALRLKFFNMEAPESDIELLISMMEYTFNRLTGSSAAALNAHRSFLSYECSVKRALSITEQFLSCTKDGAVLLEENAVIDSFISNRMNIAGGLSAPWEFSYFAAVWAKSYLRSGFTRLMKLAQQETCRTKTNSCALRRVPLSYLCLADRIMELAAKLPEDSHSCSGLKVLECGLRADAALIQLRMQTLELLESFSSEQMEHLKKQSEELPLSALGLDNTQPLMFYNAELSPLVKNLLDRKHDRAVGKVTHLGWLVLLKWLLDFDNCDADGTLTGFLKDWCGRLTRYADSKTAQDGSAKPQELPFPFEQMESFLSLWTRENTETFFESCCQIDQKTGTAVQTKHTDFQYMHAANKFVSVIVDGNMMRKPNYFLTFSKLTDALISVEEDESGQKVYTQSVRGGTVTGISIVEIRLGKIIQDCEKVCTEQKQMPAEQEEEQTLKYSASPPELLQAASEQADKTAAETASVSCPPPEPPQPPECETSSPVSPEGANPAEKLEVLLKDSLRKRTKRFSNYDRIALFQFDTKSSYYHPCTEICKYAHTRNGVKTDTDTLEYSCEEFRRQKLLEKVLELCEALKIDILLLPEYSVRPETVRFLRELMENKHKRDPSSYTFSIWAGTFRIPPNYQFDSDTFQELSGRTDIFHSAVLPVIMQIPGSENFAAYCRRFKKYPSVTLNEDINTYVPHTEPYKPITEAIWTEKKYQTGECLKGSPHLYFDARDHVTELICAELFALSSPGNMLSFADRSYQLYRQYACPEPVLGDAAEKSRAKNENDFFKAAMDDIRLYGESISLYRKDSCVCRKSILLIPACTTRAADYYILGQANYLGTGTNTVFCNGSGRLAQGGSCFIGQNSWDDRKNMGVKEDAFQVTSIYHGLLPGIFQQTSCQPGRGALGQNEQALLVCDVTPELDKRSPNPESMKNSLELVAHIPILEERIYSSECLRCCWPEEEVPLLASDWKKQCQTIQSSIQHSVQSTRKILENLSRHLTNWKNITPPLSFSDTEPYIIYKALTELGRKYHSEWLAERGKQYYRCHRLFPRYWIPETALDWLYVEVDYSKFIKAVNHKDENEDDNKNYQISVPPLVSVSPVKETDKMENKD